MRHVQTASCIAALDVMLLLLVALLASGQVMPQVRLWSLAGHGCCGFFEGAGGPHLAEASTAAWAAWHLHPGAIPHSGKHKGRKGAQQTSAFHDSPATLMVLMSRASSGRSSIIFERLPEIQGLRFIVWTVTIPFHAS